jgi:RloB-like protein
MAKRRDNLRRRAPTREPKRRFLIVCEGEITEPFYFKELRHLLRSPLELVVLPGDTPKTLVERAAQEKNSAERDARRGKDENLKYDETWCVFDVDEHPFLAEAQQQARDNDINVAISNPCFELWAVLHFQDQRAHIDRRAVQGLCRLHIPRYEKRLPCADLLHRYDDALRRAVDLEQWHQLRGTPGNNPSTGVHRLTEKIKARS